MEKFDKKIGYVGIGNMGGAIAQYLARVEFDLTVYDVRPEAMEPFAANGTKTAGSLKELVDAVDYIMICVEDDYKLIKLVTEADGILTYARKGQVIIIQSTCKISTARTGNRRPCQRQF